MRENPWDPLARKGRQRVWNSHCGKPSWPAATNRINRPDIWMQAIRSNHQKALAARGPSTYGSRRVPRVDPEVRIRLLATPTAPEVLCKLAPPQKQRAHATLERGRGEDRVRAAPAVSCAFDALENAHTSIQVQRRTLRPSLRNGFTTYNVISLVGHAVPPSPPEKR